MVRITINTASERSVPAWRMAALLVNNLEIRAAGENLRINHADMGAEQALRAMIASLAAWNGFRFNPDGSYR